MLGFIDSCHFYFSVIFKQTNASLFIYAKHDALLYVYDISITRNQPSRIKALINQFDSEFLLKALINQFDSEFLLKDLGNLHFFLGIEAKPHSIGLMLNQR